MVCGFFVVFVSGLVQKGTVKSVAFGVYFGVYFF
jgi:hypothetical protein